MKDMKTENTFAKVTKHGKTYVLENPQLNVIVMSNDLEKGYEKLSKAMITKVDMLNEMVANLTIQNNYLQKALTESNNKRTQYSVPLDLRGTSKTIIDKNNFDVLIYVSPDEDEFVACLENHEGGPIVSASTEEEVKEKFIPAMKEWLVLSYLHACKVEADEKVFEKPTLSFNWRKSKSLEK